MPKKVTKKPERSTSSYLDKIEAEVQQNQSKFNLVLGGLIVLVVGLLVFNYFSKDKSEVGTAQQTENKQSTADVSPEGLPGKYTVKDGDTLFQIAQKYYQNGDKFSEIVKANNLASADVVVTGQVLEIPKLDSNETIALNESTPKESASPQPSASASPMATPAASVVANTDQSVDWGPTITGNTYVVVEGDWLSTISARAYNGNPMDYMKIAQVNNIPNPDLIEPGMVLTIPR